jgi:hypothetical protein
MKTTLRRGVALLGASIALAEFHRAEVAKWHKIIAYVRESGIVIE